MYWKERNYVDANHAYLSIAIGNAAWPIGVTMVGIHERSAREKIFTNQVARKSAYPLNPMCRRFYFFYSFSSCISFLLRSLWSFFPSAFAFFSSSPPFFYPSFPFPVIYRWLPSIVVPPAFLFLLFTSPPCYFSYCPILFWWLAIIFSTLYLVLLITKVDVLNDETSRKYLQSLKRIMTYCQRKFPADPSKCVEYEREFFVPSQMPRTG